MLSINNKWRAVKSNVQFFLYSLFQFLPTIAILMCKISSRMSEEILTTKDKNLDIIIFICELISYIVSPLLTGKND